MVERRKKMEEDELIGLMKERWTARKFKNKEIDEDDLEKIIEAGRWAPSGGNKQPWELIVIKDDQTKEKIGEIYAEGLGLSDPPKRFTSPPVLIAVGIDKRTIDSYPEDMPADFIIYASIGAMVQNMSLVAASMGLSLSWGTQPKTMEDDIKELLELPDHIYIPDILQLGYPDQERYSSGRREAEEFTHENSLDGSKLRDID